MTRAWERFWFSTAPASTLVLVRVAFGLVVLAWGLSLAPDLAILFGPDGVVEGKRTYLLVYVPLLAGAGCMVVGYRTRIASAVVFGALLWFEHVNPWAQNSGDAVLLHLAFVLTLAPCGAALSVDARRDRRERVPEIGIWSLRLIQLQLSTIYAVAVATKLQGDAWRDGVAASLALAGPDTARFPLLDPLASSPAIAHALSWGTIGLEAALAVLVWNRRLRPWILGAGVCFHLAIDLSLRAGFFSWAMLVCYLAFVPPETSARVIERAGRAIGSAQPQARAANRRLRTLDAALDAREHTARAAAAEGADVLRGQP